MFGGNDLKNKKVLITGASGGLGSEMARLFAQHGAHVGIHYNRDAKGAASLQEALKASTKAEIFQGDLLDRKVRENLVDQFVKEFGGIDILINNAGASVQYQHFSELDEEAWDHTYTLNVKAPFYLMAKAFEHMKKQDGGRIINISSVNVKYGGSAMSLHYTSAKAALENLQKAFAKEGAKYNILVNSIRCGLIDTPMRTKIPGYNEENFLKRIQLVPLKRAGQPIDIARMAFFLAAESGNFITGETFTVAGGD